MTRIEREAVVVLVLKESYVPLAVVFGFWDQSRSLRIVDPFAPRNDEVDISIGEMSLKGSLGGGHRLKTLHERIEIFAVEFVLSIRRLRLKSFEVAKTSLKPWAEILISRSADEVVENHSG